MRFFALAVVLLCLACDPVEVDITAPQITNLIITPTPSAAIVCGANDDKAIEVTGGGVLQFELMVTDETALSQYKVDIHSNFDCHGHGNSSAPAVAVPDIDGETEDWSVLKIENLTGTNASIQEVLNVPENVTAGNYHFHIQVVDASGNDDPLNNIYTIKVSNPSDAIPPILQLSSPSENSFSASRGSMITFSGNVSDETSLSEGGNGVLFLSYTKLSTGNTFNTDAVFPFDAATSNSHDFSFTWEVPGSLTSGTYRLTVGATDGVRNVAEVVSFEVEVE